LNYNTKAEAVKWENQFCYPTNGICRGYPHETFIIEIKLLILFEFMENPWHGHGRFHGLTMVKRLDGA
jgi:hypothetical protein